MTSAINPNNIDGAYPVAGQDNNSQGFRDNFTNTATNFQYAADEITDLQNNAVLKSALTGTTLNNNMGGSVLSNAQLQDMSETVVALGTVSGSTTINLVLPAAVTVNARGIQGLNTSTGVISFAATGVYTFEFTTSNGGTTISVVEVNKQLQPFNNSSEDLNDTAAANLALTTSFFSTVTSETATLAAGVNGQIKTFAMYLASGNMVITVTNAGWGGSTITFTATGQACTLQYINGKWFCIGNNGATFA